MAKKSKYDRHRNGGKRTGYGHDWRKLRGTFIEHYPLCCNCLVTKGVYHQATTVDHIVPFEGPNDPLRLDWDNLQSLCNNCHYGIKSSMQATHGLANIRPHWIAHIQAAKFYAAVKHLLPDHLTD